jgi:Na+/citrate symporter
MSTTDDSFSVTHDPIDIQRPSLKERWWHIMDTWKIGIIPLPLFVLAGALIAIDCLGGKLPSDIVVMVATLAFFGFACGEFGKRLPIVGKLGAAAICATFIPSALVYYGLLPDVVVESTTKFYKSTNILYLYICCIIVGSIMSMNRTVLIQGFLRIFFPMLCGEIVGMKIVREALAGTQESSDLMVKIAPAHDELEIVIHSEVIKQFGEQIRQVVNDTLRAMWRSLLTSTPTLAARRHAATSSMW